MKFNTENFNKNICGKNKYICAVHMCAEGCVVLSIYPATIAFQKYLCAQRFSIYIYKLYDSTTPYLKSYLYIAINIYSSDVDDDSNSFQFHKAKKLNSLVQ